MAIAIAILDSFQKPLSFVPFFVFDTFTKKLQLVWFLFSQSKEKRFSSLKDSFRVASVL